MKIHGPGMQPGKQIANQIKPLTVSGRLHGSESGHDSIAARLAALFVDKGMDIPPSQLQILEAELSALGFTPAEIDSDSALRALLLLRHNIPLESLLVENTREQQPTVFERLAVLREHARTLIAEKRFPGEMKIVVEILLNDIDALFAGDQARATLRFTLEHIVETWAYALEARLRRLAEGTADRGGEQPFARTGTTAGRYDEIHTELDMLLRQLPENAGDHLPGRFIDALRESVSEFRARLDLISLGKPGTHAMFREAVAALGERLSVLAAEIEAFLTADSSRNISAGLIIGFIQEQVRELEQRLSAGFGDETVRALFSIFSEGDESAPGFREVLLKSGMVWEWRLLAWYRSGKNPAYLHSLLHEDLKGILVNFVNSMNKHRRRGRIPYKLMRLEQEAQSVIDTVTRHQIAAILSEHTERRELYLEIPFGVWPGQEYARIWTRGRRKPGKHTFDPGNLSLTFSVETSRLGKVKTLMTFSGKTVSLQFALEDERIRTLAESMGEEIRDSLNTRGYTVQAVTFSIQGDESGTEKKTNTEKRTGSVDIVG